MGKDSVQLKSIEAEEPTESDGNGGNKIEKGGKLEREDGAKVKGTFPPITIQKRVSSNRYKIHAKV